MVGSITSLVDYERTEEANFLAGKVNGIAGLRKQPNQWPPYR
jgi:hypothetical protein